MVVRGILSKRPSEPVLQSRGQLMILAGVIELRTYTMMLCVQHMSGQCLDMPLRSKHLRELR